MISRVRVVRFKQIHPDVIAMLDAIAWIVPPSVPSIEANVAPPDANGVDTDLEATDDAVTDQLFPPPTGE